MKLFDIFWTACRATLAQTEANPILGAGFRSDFIPLAKNYPVLLSYELEFRTSGLEPISQASPYWSISITYCWPLEVSSVLLERASSLKFLVAADWVRLTCHNPLLYNMTMPQSSFQNATSQSSRVEGTTRSPKYLMKNLNNSYLWGLIYSIMLVEKDSPNLMPSLLLKLEVHLKLEAVLHTSLFSWLELIDLAKEELSKCQPNDLGLCLSREWVNDSCALALLKYELDEPAEGESD